MTSKEDDIRFEESLASQPFLFIVGKERKEFHIHKEFFGKLSPALNALVNGGMKEAREGRVEWLDLEVDTFVRFAKYAYSGDYPDAEPEDLTPTPPPSVRPNSPENHQPSLPAPTAQPGESFSSAEGDEDEGGSQPTSPSEESSDLETADSEDLEDMDEDGYDDEDEEDDENEEEDDEDDEEEEISTRSEIVHTLRYEPPHLPLGLKGTMAHSSELSSTLSGGQPNITHALPQPPYSIKTYMSLWESHLQDRLFVWGAASVANQQSQQQQHQPAKRRMLASGDWRSSSSANLKYEAMRRFLSLNIPQPDAASGIWRPRLNSTAYEGWEPVFLCHARLYVLADKYGIEKLKAIALHRLHMLLASFTIFPNRVRDLVALIHIIYENTLVEDMARSMIVQFFGCVAEHVKSCDEFRTALRSDGEFADDLFQEMTSRLL